MAGAAKEKDFSKALRTLSRGDHAADQVCHETEIDAQILAADVWQYPITHGTKQLQKIGVTWPINRTGPQDHDRQLRLIRQHRLFSAELAPTVWPNGSGGIAFLERHAAWTRAGSGDATDVQKSTQGGASLATRGQKVLGAAPVDVVVFVRVTHLGHTSEMKDEVNALDGGAQGVLILE
jgi:hypothetical protein